MTAKKMTKLEMIQSLLVRRKGATIDELVAATGWKKHSITARFAAFRRQGLAVTKKEETRGVVYHARVEQAPEGEPKPPEVPLSDLDRALAILSDFRKRLAGGS